MSDKCNCYRFSPRDSLSGAVAQIADYLSKHPGWNETELRAFVDGLISANGVETFNGRSGNVTLNKDDVNNLLIANCYFAEADETIESIDVLALYKLGIRIVFTQYSSEVDAYTLAYGIEYYPATDTAKAYLFSSGSGGGTGAIVSVNGKTGTVVLNASDILMNDGDTVERAISSAQSVADGAATDATNALNKANAAYSSDNAPPYPVTSVNGKTGAITGLYDQNNPPPYPVTSVNGKTGAITGLYDQNNPPPYPVNNVNGKTGSVGLKVVDVSKGNSIDENAYIFIDEDEEYPEVVAKDSEKLDGKSIAEIMLLIYPVGSVYISVNSTSPATLFGGTWEQLHGRFLLASGSPNANTDNRFGAITGGWSASLGSTGGQDYHTLTVEEMPSHTHESQYVKGEMGYAAAGMMGSTEANWWSVDYIRATGGGQKHNNMPPYLAVNIWKRVS